jgi:hypothetical protein
MIDVNDIRSVQYTHANAESCATSQLFEMWPGRVSQSGRVQSSRTKIGRPQAQAVLTRRALLQITKREQGDHVTVGRRSTHAELVSDISDPEYRVLGGKARKDRETTLQ